MKFFYISLLVGAIIASPIRIARDTHAWASGTNNARTIVSDSVGRLFVVYSGLSGSYYQIYIAMSSDAGASWNPTWATLSSSASNNLSPSIAIDSDDTLHIVWRGEVVSGSDADLLYSKYPSPVITTICTHTGYPGANCPSIAVDSLDNLHVVWTGCPSAWTVRYAYCDRATGAWGSSEPIGTRTPSRWPSIEVDAENRPHVVYRNQYSGHYHCAHRYKDSGAWIGFNGASHDTLDQLPASVEYTSIFIDTLDNIHAIWEWMTAFASNPDSVRYRKYDHLSGNWLPTFTPYGNSATDAHTSFNGDVVTDDEGNLFILYHDNDSIFCAVSSDLGTTFPIDTLLQNDLHARYPNARGSLWPNFNRPSGGCIDYIWTWNDPDSATISLMFDRMCIEAEDIETTEVCAEFIEPLDSAWSSCSDQTIVMNIGCCFSDETLKVFSDTTTVEYYDSISMNWISTIAPDPDDWGTYWIHLDSSEWVWSCYPASSSHGDWFRSIIDFDCPDIDTAFIRIQCDNKAYIYANGTYVDTTHGNPGGGSAGWRTLYEFDLTPYFHGGEDTVSIIGYNSGGYAGMMFEIGIICASSCCGGIDTSSIDFTVNGEHYSIFDPELSWDGDSTLTFTPIAPDTLEDGDTVVACLLTVEDTCTGALDSSICRTFFVDLTAPFIYDILPIPGSIVDDFSPNIEFYLVDSLSGLDTSSVVFTVEGVSEIPTLSGLSPWSYIWTPDSAFNRNDTVDICVVATDSTDYCPDNILDTCWSFIVRPCSPMDISVECPLPCFAFSSCSTGAVVFSVSDSTDAGIDTSRVYVSVIRVIHSTYDTTYISSPSPFIIFDFTADTTITVWGNWSDGDSVFIQLDSLYNLDGCLTVP
ncbi:hypothetical protein KAH81_04755 [bacterium]|nr:hypothetical protein [bacterium]